MNILKQTELETFYTKFTKRTYKKGEILIRADDDPQGLFCLNKGYIRQYSISKTGIELVINIIKPTSYFPLIWAINNKANIYYFEALTQADVRRAPKDEILNFIKDKPPIILVLMSDLLNDHEETINRVEHLVFSDAYKRVISILLYLIKHFGKVRGNGIIVHQRFTQQDIASLVGVARETANCEMIRLEKKGLIRYIDHSIFFTNIKLLHLELY